MRFSIRRGAGLVPGLLLGLQTILTTAIDLNPDDPGMCLLSISIILPFGGGLGVFLSVCRCGDMGVWGGVEI